jgi:DNA repair photolyase
MFEPDAPPIKERVSALDELHQAGIRTFVMIAPILPGAESLAEILRGKVDRVIFDRMNYHYADWVYRKYGLENKMTDDYFHQMEMTLSSTFAKFGIGC